jgi:hypothetical protein
MSKLTSGTSRITRSNIYQYKENRNQIRDVAEKLDMTRINFLLKRQEMEG